MTPTQKTVTTEEYEQGSSARCTCGERNYFLVSLSDVTFQWECCHCGDLNYHPNHAELRKRFDALKNCKK